MRAGLLLCVLALAGASDIPLAPRVRHTASTFGHAALQPAMHGPPAVAGNGDARAHHPTPSGTEALVQSESGYVDADGDEHIVTNLRLERGQMGSTDHLKDDQFFLNIPFSEVEFNSYVDVTWVRPANATSKLDYIGLFTQGDSEDAIPCNWEFAEGDGGSGKTRVQMTNHGKMELRYFDVAADRSRVKLPLLVYPPCPNNCTNHGICTKGVCVCLPPYKGEECCEVGGKIAIELNSTKATVGQGLHVTLTPPAGELDTRNWVALFAVDDAGALIPSTKIHQALIQTTTSVPDSAQPAAQAEEVEFINITETRPLLWRYAAASVEMTLPYVPGKYVVKVVKNIESHQVIGSSAIIVVVPECPNKCSGHGACVDGACLCEEGYKETADCSLGDGMVVLSVSPSECLVGAVLNVSWERNADGGFSQLDYIALFEKSDENFDAPFAYQFAQPSAQNVTSELFANVKDKRVDRGFVEFTAPAARSDFVARYFRQDHVQFAASAPIAVYFDCASKTCSNHGKCVHGECKCNDGWKGADCSLGDGPTTVSSDKSVAVVSSNITVTWTRPVKGGSDYDFVGIYRKTARDDQPYTYRYALNTNKNGKVESDSFSIRLPHTPGLYDIRYIDAFKRTQRAISAVIDVHLPCPNACSGHGTCQKDTCVCKADWTARDDCSAKVGVAQLTATPLTLETPSKTKIVVTYKRPEGSGNDGDFIGLFPKGQADNRRPIDFAVPTADFGKVEFNAPHYEGLFVARYVDGISSQSRAHSLEVDVTKACLNRCSQHGKCNRGVCECTKDWGGLDCSIGQGPTSVQVGPKLGHPGDKIVISYTRPINSGSASDLLAIVKVGQKDLSTPLGFVMATDKDKDSVEATMPSVEGELEVHYMRATDLSSQGRSASFKVTFPCKDECNEHGDCSNGFCSCSAGWDGFACEKSVPTAFQVIVTPSTVAPMGSISVSWQAIPKQSTPSDYVAIFSAADTQRTAPITYEYTSMQPTGTVTMSAPYSAGDYVLVYISNSGGLTVSKAQSDTFSVVIPPKSCPKACSDHGTCDTTTGDCKCDAGWDNAACDLKVPTEWSVRSDNNEYAPGYWIEARWTRPPHNEGNYLDQIGLFETGPTRKLEAIQFQYTGPGNEGKLMFAAPTPPSDSLAYELRFTNGATGRVEASSGMFDVTKPVGAKHSKHAKKHSNK
eukprot:c25307_g1_i1.p1 GENE.c25307_g1_i1~~c25307_g1_i1.p1  ORF type:complete len:1192 (-),score=246.30 c25307_g1_i1:40-3585(-)